jgi:TRAP-type C4-dicarboxylate transport system permease small subunit
MLSRGEFGVRIFSIGGGIATVGLFLFILLAIASRIFRFHLEGQVEISNLLLAAIACFGLGYALLEKAHVGVDWFSSRLPSRWQTITESFCLLLAMAFFAIIVWSTGSSACSYWIRMVYTEGTIAVPKWVASFLIALGCLVMVLALLIQFLACITHTTRR